MGAHPGGLYTGDVPVDGYGEDYDFWVDARAATRAGADEYDAWIKHWVLDVETQEQWLERLGPERIAVLRAKADPESWRADAAAYPPDLDAPVNGWERAAVWGARHLAARVVATGANAVLAGAGVANLAAWLGVQIARDAGSDVKLTAEIGLWDYDATLGDPFVLNHRNFPTATMLADAQFVLGALVGGSGTTTIGCLGGAQIDRVRQHQLDVDPAPPVPRRFGRRQRRGEHRGRERDRRHAHCATHGRRLRLHHVAGHARAGARHRPRDVREARRRVAGRPRSRPASRSTRCRRCADGSSRCLPSALPVLDEPTDRRGRRVAALGSAGLVPPRSVAAAPGNCD